jgi:hypothetical protein
MKHPARTPSHVGGRPNADTERLDWLETWADGVDRFGATNDRWRVFTPQLDCGERPTGRSIRDAIDAAMREMQQMDVANETRDEGRQRVMPWLNER